MQIANYWPVYTWPANYWPDWPPQVIEPDGLAVAVAIGTATVYLAGVAQDIAPDGLAVAAGLGAVTLTRRAAVDVPLYVIDLDTRTWLVPAESRVYEVDG